MPIPSAPPAVVLLSGGLDSTTVLAVAQRDGFTPYAMTFRYRQRHSVETHAPPRCAAAQGGGSGDPRLAAPGAAQTADYASASRTAASAISVPRPRPLWAGRGTPSRRTRHALAANACRPSPTL